MKNEDAGFLFIKTEPKGTVVSIFEPNVDINFSQFMELVHDFSIACGYSETIINDYLEPSAEKVDD